MLRVAEAHVGLFKPAEPLDIDLVGGVDEDVTDGRVREQRREWPHADRLVGQLLGQTHALRFVERNILGGDGARRELFHRRRQVSAVALEEAALADFVEQPLLQRRLHAEVIRAAWLGRLRRAEIRILTREAPSA